MKDPASAEEAGQGAILEIEVPGRELGLGLVNKGADFEKELAAFAAYAVPGPGSYDAVPHHSHEQALPLAAKPHAEQPAGQISAVYAELGSAAAAPGHEGNADHLWAQLHCSGSCCPF